MIFYLISVLICALMVPVVRKELQRNGQETYQGWQLKHEIAFWITAVILTFLPFLNFFTAGITCFIMALLRIVEVFDDDSKGKWYNKRIK